MKKNGNFKAVLGTFVAFIMCTLMFTAIYYNSNGDFGIQEATYLQFKQMANNGEIESASIRKDKTTFEFITKDGKKYVTENPDYDSFKFDMMEHGIQVQEIQPVNTSSIVSLIINAIFIGAMFYILSSVMKQQNGGMGKRLIKPEKDEKEEININTDGKKKVNKRRTSFKDVAGLKQVKEDMVLLVDFLKNPKQYIEAGAKLPKGVIFYGPPGTGKTLLAKALAGEAGVPFFNLAGSDFIEMFVGLGAKRVRELFEEARKNAPCIVFIDELDAIGNSRSNVSSGATEHRQTINALLSEMDGFNGSEGILVIGATNRVEDLDTALIRPGRFDKHIAIPLPETAEERLECIKMYAENKKFSEDVDFDVLSKETIGFSPADIEALLNEAVLISVQKKKQFIDKDCIDSAIYKKLLQGHAKEDSKRDKDEIELVAWHEAGHAVIGKLCNMDVSKVTIIPSTSGTGGVNIIIPKKMGMYSIQELKDNIKMSYGGRCAEYLLYGDWNRITTGASSDIKQATATIYNMISMYGMTEEYGMLNLNELNIDNKEILQKAVEMSKELMNETLEMLKANREMHQAVVNVLLEKETISGKELDEIYKKYKIVSEEAQNSEEVKSTEVETEKELVKEVELKKSFETEEVNESSFEKDSTYIFNLNLEKPEIKQDTEESTEDLKEDSDTEIKSIESILETEKEFKLEADDVELVSETEKSFEQEKKKTEFILEDENQFEAETDETESVSYTEKQSEIRTENEFEENLEQNINKTNNVLIEFEDLEEPVKDEKNIEAIEYENSDDSFHKDEDVIPKQETEIEEMELPIPMFIQDEEYIPKFDDVYSEIDIDENLTEKNFEAEFKEDNIMIEIATPKPDKNRNRRKRKKKQ